MFELRFKGMASDNKSLADLLYEWAGYRAVRDGKDLVVPASDPALMQGPRDCIKLHGQVTLSKDDYAGAAKSLVSVVPDTFDEYYHRNTKKYQFTTEEHNTTVDFYSHLLDLTFAKPNEIESVLREKILPFMVEKMNAILVTPVTVDSSYQQIQYSIAKFSLLLNKYGLKTTKKLVFDKEVLSGILPNQLAPLTYINALTRHAPWALTLPVDRADCVWHFQTDGMWEFPYVHTVGLYQHFISQLSPAAERPEMHGLSGLDKMSEANISQFLRLTVEGVNRLMRYLNDPRNFIDHTTGAADLEKQLQAHSAVHLLFADLTEINSSTNSHHRISYTMSGLDKITNLKRYLGEIDGQDQLIFRSLATSAHENFLAECFENKTIVYGHELKSVLVGIVRETYTLIRKHYLDDMNSSSPTEDEMTERLWHQRNLRHGAFLTGGKFNKLFGQSKGTVPDDVVTLPLLFTLALVLDPQGFLRFSPTS